MQELIIRLLIDIVKDTTLLVRLDRSSVRNFMAACMDTEIKIIHHIRKPTQILFIFLANYVNLDEFDNLNDTKLSRDIPYFVQQPYNLFIMGVKRPQPQPPQPQPPQPQPPQPQPPQPPQPSSTIKSLTSAYVNGLDHNALLQLQKNQLNYNFTSVIDAIKNDQSLKTIVIKIHEITNIMFDINALNTQESNLMAIINANKQYILNNNSTFNIYRLIVYLIAQLKHKDQAPTQQTLIDNLNLIDVGLQKASLRSNEKDQNKRNEEDKKRQNEKDQQPPQYQQQQQKNKQPQSPYTNMNNSQLLDEQWGILKNYVKGDVKKNNNLSNILKYFNTYKINNNNIPILQNTNTYKNLVNYLGSVSQISLNEKAIKSDDHIKSIITYMFDNNSTTRIKELIIYIIVTYGIYNSSTNKEMLNKIQDIERYKKKSSKSENKSQPQPPQPHQPQSSPAPSQPPPASSQNYIRFMTWNVLNHTLGLHHYNGNNYNIDLFTQNNLNLYTWMPKLFTNYDVVFLQEVVPNLFNKISTSLNSNFYVITGNSQNANSISVILCRRTIFNYTDGNSFSHVSDGNKITLGCNVLMKGSNNKETKNLLINCWLPQKAQPHFDFIYGYTKDVSNNNLIIAGDFNMTSNDVRSMTYKQSNTISQYIYCEDTALQSTFFSPTANVRYIDLIYVNCYNKKLNSNEFIINDMNKYFIQQINEASGQNFTNDINYYRHGSAITNMQAVKDNLQGFSFPSDHMAIICNFKVDPQGYITSIYNGLVDDKKLGGTPGDVDEPQSNTAPSQYRTAKPQYNTYEPQSSSKITYGLFMGFCISLILLIANYIYGFYQGCDINSFYQRDDNYPNAYHDNISYNTSHKNCSCDQCLNESRDNNLFNMGFKI